MKQDQHDHPDFSHLQHDADHVKPRKKNSVISYITILFAAAFLLLLLSYLMQQRNSEAVISGLQNTSVSAVASLENLIKENASLEQQVKDLEIQINEMETALASAKSTSKEKDLQLAGQTQETRALMQLNLIRALYNQRQYNTARELLESWEAVSPNGLESILSQISDSLPEAEREIYDPLEAYHTIYNVLY